jgi:hypothetical protein
MRMVMGHPDWVAGFQDETWWSRFEQPNVYTWCEADQPLRLVEQVKDPEDSERNALACYGLLMKSPTDENGLEEKVLLRFVDGRPVSEITIQFLAWCCERLQAMGKRVWVLIWDNASWHISKAVRTWIHEHNRQVKRSGQGVRILGCLLPVKSPWLNPIEPKWMHAKRKVAEPDRTLSIQELADRVCANFDCPHEDHLSISVNVV